LAIGKSKNLFESKGYINIMLIDTNLNLQWGKRYAVNKPLIANSPAIIDDENNIIIGASCLTYAPNWQSGLLFMKIKENGDSLEAKYETNGNPQRADIYSILEINGHLKAFVNGYKAYTPYTGFSQILELDQNFNLLGVKPVPFIIEAYMTAGKTNEYDYFVTGRSYSAATHYDVGIAKLSTYEDSLAYNHAGKPGIAVDYSGWLKCMAISNPNSIYTGGTGNDNGLFYSCYITNKVLILSNYDSLLNCRWTRFYGSDTACYTLSTLKATSDGGCIMGGMYYTPAHPENLLDAVLIKVDSLGLFTSLSDNRPMQIHEAIIYPNPGQDFITIQSGPQIIGAEFKMYDAKGSVLIQTRLASTLEQMDAKALPEGVYAWQIIYKGRCVEHGKWIKQ
jgi:hypothetical protein